MDLPGLGVKGIGRKDPGKPRLWHEMKVLGLKSNQFNGLNPVANWFPPLGGYRPLGAGSLLRWKGSFHGQELSFF